MRQALSGVASRLWRGIILVSLSLPLALALPLWRPAGEAAEAVAPPVSTQWVYPVGSPTIMPSYADGNGNGYAITQGFNTSCDPAAGQGHYYAGYFFCGHTGVDLSANGSYGGVVRAAAAGLVVFAGPNGSYGNMVRIEHLLPDGHAVYSQYEHLAYNSLTVWYGEIVACGQQIGAVGDTGFAQGAHLHFEIKDSNSDGPGYTFGNASLLAGYYDPLAFVAAHMVAPTAPPAAVATAVAAPLPRARPQPPTAARSSGPDGESAAVLSRFLHRYAHFVTVTTPALRLRAGPSFSARQLSIVKGHTKLALLGVSGRWLRVALPQDVTGWVLGDFVSGPIPASLRQPAKTRPTKSATTRALGFRMRAPRPNLRRLGPLAQVAMAGVRVHNGPHLGDRMLFLTQRGSMVAVRSLVGGWARVTFTNGATGWMMAGYLHLPASLQPHRAAKTRARHAPRPDLHRLGPLARVIGDAVHVRSGPRLSAGVLFMAYHGSMVAVRGLHVSWARVTFTNGATGWMMTHYLQMPGQQPARRPALPLPAGPQPVVHIRPSAGPVSPGEQPASPRPRRAVAPVPALPSRQTSSAAARVAPTYYTWATTLYVRSAPRLSAGVVALAGENTPVRLLGTHVSWSHVRLPDGTEGWALSHYVQDHRKIYLTMPAAQ